MSTAGYSSTPLLKKLGLKPEYRIWLLNPPADYADLLEYDPTPQIADPKNPKQVPDWAHQFAINQKEFEKGMRILTAVAKKNPRLTVWVSWYKKAARIPTDLDENIIRDYALANGWVDVKVCAVSEQWSGLKLVIPLSKR